MRARIVLSTIIVSLLLSACGNDAPTPVVPKSSASTAVLDAGPDADFPGENGIGTSPNITVGGAYDDDPAK